MIHTPLDHVTERINGIDMHIVIAGPSTGKPLLLLHGFPEYWYSWRRQIDSLVEAGYRLYMPDQRGYNLSDKPKSVADYSLDVLADDIAGLIDFMGVERGCVVAHDWGGGAAWWAANKMPERFEKLALLNIPHHAVFSRHVRKSKEQRRKSWYMAFFQLRTVPEVLVRLGNWTPLARWAFGSSPAFSADDLRLYKRAWSQPGAMTGMINWYRAIRQNPPESLESPAIHVNTLLIWGKRDPVLGWEMAQPSIDLCDEGRLVLIDEATHWVQHEAADEVNALLIDFFKD